MAPFLNKNFAPYINRWAIYNEQGRKNDAEAEYEIASKYDPKNFYAYYKMGLSYDDLKKYNDSIAGRKKPSELSRKNFS